MIFITSGYIVTAYLLQVLKTLKLFDKILLFYLPTFLNVKLTNLGRRYVFLNLFNMNTKKGIDEPPFLFHHLETV